MATTGTRADPARGKVIDLRPVFAPRSIAVVGASPRSNIAQVVRDNLRVMASPTRCHFVNPRYDRLHDQPCHPSLRALPETPDVAVLAVNPFRAAVFAREAAEAGVRGVIIPGGGVVEGGEAAAVMQREVAAIAREHGLAVIGPNCMGFVDFTTNAAAYIGDVSPWLPRGGVAAIAQSGSVSDAFIHSGDRIGFSRIVSCGAEVALDVCDYLAYSLDDPETHAIALFIEGFKRPERFLALADRALELGKPILALKVGRTDQAAEAAIAHTGSLAGEARATDAALDAVGVVRCGDLDELLEACALVEGVRRTGRRVGRGRTGVVTVSTGEASLVVDLAPRTGIDLPPIPEDARAAIAGALPTMGFVANPLDPWGAADAATAYGACFEALAASGAYDVLAVVHDVPYRSLPSEVEVADTVTRALLAATHDRPAILPAYVSLTSGEHPPETRRLLDEEGGGAPLLRGAVEAFSAIARVARWEARHGERAGGEPRRDGWATLAADRTSRGFDATSVKARHDAVGRDQLSERESLALLAEAGLAVVGAVGVTSVDEAVAATRAFGCPVVLKLDAIGLPHKADVGGVRVGLGDEGAVREAALDLLALPMPAGVERRGLLVAPVVPGEAELIVGARRDPLFGPVVLVGLGGVLAEALDDVAVGLAPVDHDEARALLRSLRAARLLDAQRGRPAVDLDAIADLVVRLGDLLVTRDDLLEIDLNPVIAGARGAVGVDALIVCAVAGPSDGVEGPGPTYGGG